MLRRLRGDFMMQILRWASPKYRRWPFLLLSWCTDESPKQCWALQRELVLASQCFLCREAFSGWSAPAANISATESAMQALI